MTSEHQLLDGGYIELADRHESAVLWDRLERDPRGEEIGRHYRNSAGPDDPRPPFTFTLPAGAMVRCSGRFYHALESFDVTIKKVGYNSAVTDGGLTIPNYYLADGQKGGK